MKTALHFTKEGRERMSVRFWTAPVLGRFSPDNAAPGAPIFNRPVMDGSLPSRLKSGAPNAFRRVVGCNRSGKGASHFAKEGGFTMVEIAISLGVIAFALVALIGVLPMGMGVQRENREDTLINLDGQYFLDAMRGAQGVDNLTNFVEYITIETTDGSGDTNVARYYDDLAFPNVPQLPPPPGGIDAHHPIIRNGRDIIGLLTTPKYMPGLTNKVTASIHSLNGAAIEQGVSTRELSYGYQLTTEVVPFAFVAGGSIAHANNDPDPQNLARSNRFLEVETLNKGQVFGNIGANMFDVRLSLRWPLKPDGTGGPRRQRFRAVVSGQLKNEPPSQVAHTPPPMWFFQSQQYEKKP